MQRIRKLAYKLGFHPKITSLFFSPSLEMVTWADSTTRFKEGIEEVLNETNE